MAELLVECDTKIAVKFSVLILDLPFKVHLFNLYLTQGSREIALTVVDEEDSDTLLLHHITSDDIYRKQEGEVVQCPSFKIGHTHSPKS